MIYLTGIIGMLEMKNTVIKMKAAVDIFHSSLVIKKRELVGWKMGQKKLSVIQHRERRIQK